MLQSLLNKSSSPVSTAVAGLVATAVVVTIYWTASTASKKGANDPSSRKPPYLKSTVPLVGNMLDLMRNSPRLHDWIAEQLLPRDGQPIMLRLPGKPDLMIVSRPEHLEEILKTQFDSFPKSEIVHDALFDFGGDSIITTNGETWKRQRQVFLGLFGARALRENMTPLSQKYAAELCKILADAAVSKETLDVFHLIHGYTLDVFAEIGFGTKMGLLQARSMHPNPFEEALENAQNFSGQRLKQPVALWKLKRWLNVGNERKLREAIDLLDEHVMGIVSDAFERKRLDRERTEAERAATPERKDIISIILNRMQSDKDPMSPSTVRDIAIAAVVAGRDTTADSLGWLFHVLAQNPRVEAKLRAELLAKIPKLATDDSYVPSPEEINAVTYVEATIRELLRLYPAGAFIQTHCARDVVFADGTFVPGNTDMWLAFYTTGRLKSVWGPDAEVFIPERFLDPETGKLLSVPNSKFCAFSNGPRSCVGQTLAMLEMKMVVATVFSRFHLSPDPQQKEVKGQEGITIGMENPLLMRIERVTPSAVGAVA